MKKSRAQRRSNQIAGSKKVGRRSLETAFIELDSVSQCGYQ